MPLAILHEQKRKIKIDINKKKKGGGMGLKNKFATNNTQSKLAGISKLAKKVEFTETQKVFQTNLEQINFNLERPEEKPDDFFAFNNDFSQT